MLITQAQLINVSGLHARPASDFVKLAKSFQSKIIVRSADAPDEDAVNAKSIVMILSQGFSRLRTMKRVVLSPSVLMLGTRTSSP